MQHLLGGRKQREVYDIRAVVQKYLSDQQWAQNWDME